MIHNNSATDGIDNSNLLETLKNDFHKQVLENNSYESLIIGENNNKPIELFMAWIPDKFEVTYQKGELKMGNMEVPVFGIKAEYTRLFKEKQVEEQLEVVKKCIIDLKKKEPWRTSFEVNVGDFPKEVTDKIINWAQIEMGFHCIYDKAKHEVYLDDYGPVDFAKIFRQLSKGYNDLVYTEEKSNILERMAINARANLGYVEVFNKDKHVLQYLVNWLLSRGRFIKSEVEETNIGYKVKIIWDNERYKESTSRTVKC